MTDKNNFHLRKQKKTERFYDIGNGKKATLKEIKKITGLSYHTVYARIKKGYRGQDLLNVNLRKEIGHVGKTFKINGEDLTIPAIAQKYNIPASTIYRRAELGYEGEKLISGKKRSKNINSFPNVDAEKLQQKYGKKINKLES